MAKQIIPPSLAIKSMRSSGYRDTAYAVAELVDNSIEAGAAKVEILCADRDDFSGGRKVRRLDRIAVFDNGKGMSPEMLETALTFGGGSHEAEELPTGIGKFGMGLPNSSISQCERVDVWSWQEGKCFRTYLDVREILSGKLESVPPAEEAEIPADWKSMISSPIAPNGTLVVWSRPDRVHWRTSRALLDNSKLLIGRIYRSFIQEGTVSIRAAAFVESDTGGWETQYDETVRANDPLYLMSGTSTPAPYSEVPMFEQFGPPMPITVRFRGEEHTVLLTFSITTKEVRQQHGYTTSPISTHARKNTGISLVRAKRELELSQAFVLGYDPRDRWWGAEVQFPPALDDVFAVPNNKQGAPAFQPLDLEEDAAAAGLSPAEYKETLRATDDPRLVMYEISNRIEANLGPMREQIRRFAKPARKREVPTEPTVDPAESTATRATEERKREGHEGTSDRQENAPAEQRAGEIVEQMVADGFDREEAEQIAVEHVQSNIKYIFEEASLEGAAFFSVRSKGGAIIVYINSNHEAAKHFYDLLAESGEDTSNEALQGLKILLCAWARMEDETLDPRQKARLGDIRTDWGRMARDFLLSADA